MILFQNDDIALPALDAPVVRAWIAAVAAAYGRTVGPLAYIFCSDERILAVNRQFLGHDYYTDIITFDYSHDAVASGDMFISLDTVRTNSALFAQCYDATRFRSPYEQELHRVVIHGILHLCGLNDKGPGERELMEAAEDRALALFPARERHA